MAEPSVRRGGDGAIMLEEVADNSRTGRENDGPRRTAASSGFVSSTPKMSFRWWPFAWVLLLHATSRCRGFRPNAFVNLRLFHAAGDHPDRLKNPLVCCHAVTEPTVVEPRFENDVATGTSTMKTATTDLVGGGSTPATVVEAGTDTSSAIFDYDRHLRRRCKAGAVLVRGNDNDNDGVVIRVATPSMDADIARLRLSVFTDFSPDLHAQFCVKSCQALAARRGKGAVCLVAGDDRGRPGVLLGTAECSFHEFDGTALGACRPREKLLYVAEVAVRPDARRRGIGRKLFRAVDLLAQARRVETIYLHVDVANAAAIALYAKAGYQPTSAIMASKVRERMFLEFTTSLLLHKGASHGREHYLFYKDLTPPTWLSVPSPSSPSQSVKRKRRDNAMAVTSTEHRAVATIE